MGDGALLFQGGRSPASGGPVQPWTLRVLGNPGLDVRPPEAAEASPEPDAWQFVQLGQAVDVCLSGSKIAAFNGVVKQAVYAVPVILIIFRRIDSALRGN